MSKIQILTYDIKNLKSAFCVLWAWSGVNDEMARSKMVLATFLSKTGFLVKIPLNYTFLSKKFSLTKFFPKRVNDFNTKRG